MSTAASNVAAQVSTYLNARTMMAGQPLSAPKPADELLHPPAASGHYSATETSYYGFNIPEHRINGEIYLWFHPVLRVMSASIYIWKGDKPATLACEYVNHHHYLPMPTGPIDDFEVAEVGLRIRVLEPLKSVLLECSDRDRGVSFRVQMDAVAPPAGRPGGFHFTQAMRTRGSLDLYGERFEIDGYFSRDRSWGQERRETSRVGPPFTWMVGVFDDDFAFHATAFDSPEAGPEWLSRYPIEPGRNLGWGYVWRDRQLFSLTAARKSTLRKADGVTPSGYSLVLEDSGGATHRLRGEVAACMPWQTWQNMNVFFCMTRWESERGVGWGDSQDIQQNDFVRNFTR